MTDQEQEKDKGFKVEDRRRFSAEGEAKPEVGGAEEKHDADAGVPPLPGSGAATASEARAKPPHASEELTFTSYIVGLSTGALVHLGEMPHPETGEPARDLPAAQQIIDILGILQDKTRGNLSEHEQGLLEDILFNLRMKYVEIARQPG